MNLDNIEQTSTKISKSLIKSLKHQYPSNQISKAFEDIVVLLMYELLNGNIYINLNEYKPPIKLKSKGWPKEHIKTLKKSGWTKGDIAPIVLNEGNLSWKRWDVEMTSTLDILLEKNRCSSGIENCLPSDSYTSSTNYLNDEQQAAVNAIVNQMVILLSGGPGTGKTSTILHMLEKILNLDPNLKIGLAAPTGKAAKRLQDSLLKNLENIDSKLKDTISKIPCKTLHSWLQANPTGFGRNKSHPLNINLLVIDEMSMVNIVLMQAVLDALPLNTRLVLVGDLNQLPPIGSGSIWQELHSKPILKRFSKGTINLSKVYRNRGEIASLSKIINDSNLQLFWEKASNQGESSNVQLTLGKLKNIPENVLSELQQQQIQLKELLHQFKNDLPKDEIFSSTTKIQANEINNKIFKCLDELMVLTPKRNGWWGVNHVNRSLLGTAYDQGLTHWPEATPIICTENQQDLGLSNGDIGLVIGELKDRRFLFRIISDEQHLSYSLIYPARLRNIEPAYALTIHKAQGSESNKVILLWPNSINTSIDKHMSSPTQEVFNKRLLYTAITRAKDNLQINIPNN